MTEEQWRDIEVGQRVRILAGHPWAGHCGTVTAVQQIRGRGLLYPKVAVDEGPGVPKGGHPSFVVYPSQAELI